MDENQEPQALPTGTKAVLATLFELVVFLFAGFNGYLTKLAPPASRAGGMSPAAAVGFASFAALLVFLLAKVWMRHSLAEQYKRRWFAITVALTVFYLAAGFEYQRKTSDVTFLYPLGDLHGNVEVIGERLTAEGKAAVAVFRGGNGRDPLPAELIAEDGGDRSKIIVYWEPASVREAHDALVWRYVLFVVVISAALASLIELMSLSGPLQPTPSPGTATIRIPDADDGTQEADRAMPPGEGTPVLPPPPASPPAGVPQ